MGCHYGTVAVTIGVVTPTLVPSTDTRSTVINMTTDYGSLTYSIRAHTSRISSVLFGKTIIRRFRGIKNTSAGIVTKHYETRPLHPSLWRSTILCHISCIENFHTKWVNPLIKNIWRIFFTRNVFPDVEMIFNTLDANLK